LNKRRDKREKKAMKFIMAFRDKMGVSPTRQEIAEHMGYDSTSSVQIIVNSLAVQNKIKVIPGFSRGIVPTDGKS